MLTRMACCFARSRARCQSCSTSEQQHWDRGAITHTRTHAHVGTHMSIEVPPQARRTGTCAPMDGARRTCVFRMEDTCRQAMPTSSVTMRTSTPTRFTGRLDGHNTTQHNTTLQVTPGSTSTFQCSTLARGHLPFWFRVLPNCMRTDTSSWW